MPSFPRRRESCLIFKNRLKNNLLHKLNQDSRLRGNDGEFTISYGVLGFAKVSDRVSGCLDMVFRLLIGFRLPMCVYKDGCWRRMADYRQSENVCSNVDLASRKVAQLVFRLPKQPINPISTHLPPTASIAPRASCHSPPLAKS